jgi:nitrite reductase/ring-hydroxylating ferredoxin subunit
VLEHLVETQRPEPALRAPPASAFSRWPASWYRLCSSRTLDRGPFARTVFDRRLVGYRRRDGSAVVLDAVCSHLGADLGNGRVVGDCLACPFHEWQYGPDGRCRRVPGMASPPEFARQTSFPVEERHGSVFFFHGARPTFPLPFFLEEQPDEYRAIEPRRFLANCTWYMVNAHAFDLQHFATVHGRRLTGPLQVDCPTAYARRSRYCAEVVGTKYYDRFLRSVVGREVEITLTIWGGTFAVVTGDFGKRRSRFFVISEPRVEGTTQCDVVVFTPRFNPRPLARIFEPLMLRLRRFLTTAYLRDESHSLGQPRYNQASLTEVDREMIEFFHWAAELE